MEIAQSKVRKPRMSPTTEMPKLEAPIMAAILENAPINVMLANLNGEITFLNRKSIETLTSIEDELPIAVSEIVGSSYDVFHKNPAHQRKLLSTDRSLPHRAIITVGKEKLDLLVSPLYDETGTYVGPLVTWDVVTEKLKLQEIGRAHV